MNGQELLEKIQPKYFSYFPLQEVAKLIRPDLDLQTPWNANAHPDDAVANVLHRKAQEHYAVINLDLNHCDTVEDAIIGKLRKPPQPAVQETPDMEEEEMTNSSPSYTPA